MSEDQISPPTGGMLGQWADRITETGWFKFLKIFQVVAIIIAVVVFGIDYQQRQQDRGVRAEEHAARVEEHKARAEERNARAEDRLARMWSLATDPHPGNRLKILALEFLNENKHPLSEIAIPKAYLVGIKIPGANLFNANLSGANLIDADLSDAILFKANLSEANLSEANLIGAILSRANFSKANLSGADLIGANLNGANLSEANLSLADLDRVTNLTQNQLDHACIDAGIAPEELPAGLNPPTRQCPERK